MRSALRVFHTRWLKSLAVVLTSSMLLVGCSLSNNSVSYRYRLTVQLNPQGVRTGSGVIETRISERSGLNGHMVHSELRGEAVSVDIPQIGTVFALLDAGDGSAPFVSAAYYRLMPSSIAKNQDWRVRQAAISEQTVSAEMPEEYYPIIVYFDNLNDPHSASRLDDGQLASKRLQGVSIKRIFVQITHDPVSAGIEKKIPWIRRSGAYYQNGQSINRRSFVRGELQ